MNTTVNHSVLSGYVKDKQASTNKFRTVFPSNSYKHSKNYKIKDKDHFKDLNVDGSIIFNKYSENIRCEDVDWIKLEQDGAKLRAVANMTMVRRVPLKQRPE